MTSVVIRGLFLACLIAGFLPLIKPMFLGAPQCDPSIHEFITSDDPCDAKCSDPTNYDTCQKSGFFTLACRCRHGHYRNAKGVCVDLDGCQGEHSGHPWTKCERERIDSSHPMVAAHVPPVSCDPTTGNYHPKQCMESSGVCYCIHPITGTEIEGTETLGGNLQC